MKILIIGAADYIGGRIVESLCTKDWIKAFVGRDIKEPEKRVAGLHQMRS